MTKTFSIVTYLLFAFLCDCSAWLPESAPPYCSNDMNMHKIPLLTTQEEGLIGRLKQVQVMIRHGARTPYSKFSCWKEYDLDWINCNVTDLLSVSDVTAPITSSSSWWFRKVYDGSENLLGGNCLTGQLIGEGYRQEQMNGQILANAYLKGTKLLFPTQNWDDIDYSKVYLRSDDDASARVVMSAQIVLQSMFKHSDDASIVNIHTGDYSLDQIYPNSKVCPRLDSVQQAAYSSQEWIGINTSDTMLTYNNSLSAILGDGSWSWYNLMDCFMTAVCTGRGVPEGAADLKMTQELFDGSIKIATDAFAYLMRFNNSQWSKLAMGNTAWHVKTRLEAAVRNDDNALKLAIYAGICGFILLYLIRNSLPHLPILCLFKFTIGKTCIAGDRPRYHADAFSCCIAWAHLGPGECSSVQSYHPCSLVYESYFCTRSGRHMPPCYP